MIWLTPKPNEIPHLNIITISSGEKYEAEPIHGIKAIKIYNDMILAQTQEHVLVLNEKGRVVTKAKLRSTFPSMIPFKDFVISFDPNLYTIAVIDLSGSKPQIDKIPFPKSYRVFCYFLSGDLLSLLIQDKKNEKYLMVKMDVTNREFLPGEIELKGLDKRPAAVVVNGKEIELFFHHNMETKVYSL
jgi:hypothetical protein